ncbi:S1 family peptidase [Vibrio sp. PNB22_8_1]|uniref:S1 family peptidase n=1 Tax=unclassified Vibrio TaxID=2614977 RepID=UPI00406A163D
MTKGLLYICYLFVLSLVSSTHAAGLPNTIEKIKPSIVAIGTYNRLSSPTSNILGTGFVVGDGHQVATNAHVIPSNLNAKKEKLVIYIGQGANVEMRYANVEQLDTQHDLAVIKISGKPLKPLSLSSKHVKEGELFAFTGFPIGAILGLNPVTHRGIISSITPVATPAKNTKSLTIKQLKALKNPYNVYQLDATAYPGNSGSPVFDPQTGEVVAVINKVLVKSTKESLLSDPSAITYAIPIKHLKKLL